ncbi:MAG: hypothetical protein ACLPSF_05405, partial [Methylocella sp.]
MDARPENDPPIDPTDPYEREGQTFPRLTPEQIARAATFGTQESLPRGAILFERGDRRIDFFVVLDGAIEIIDQNDCEPSVIRVHTAG